MQFFVYRGKYFSPVTAKNIKKYKLPIHCNGCYATWIIQNVDKNHFVKAPEAKEYTCCNCGLTEVNNVL